MLEIRLERRAEGLCLEAKGHAGCGERGRDLLCAGASMLAQTLRAALTEAERAGAGRLEQAQLQSGQGYILFRPRGGDGRAAQIFATVRAGFALLAEAAPEAVRLAGNL